MSLRPLDDAMTELARVWSASDHFDQKVLQFVGIVAAGSLAAAAIAADRIAVILQNPLGWVVLTMTLGAACFFLRFLFLAIDSVMKGTGFSGGVDPRLLAERLDELRDPDIYQRSLLAAVAAAFERSINGHEDKWRILRLAVRDLKIGLVVSALAMFTLMAGVQVQGRSSMGTHAKHDPRSAEPSPPKPADRPKPTYPVVGPYEITKGEKIPNVPLGKEAEEASKHPPR